MLTCPRDRPSVQRHYTTKCTKCLGRLTLASVCHWLLQCWHDRHVEKVITVAKMV